MRWSHLLYYTVLLCTRITLDSQPASAVFGGLVIYDGYTIVL